MTGATQLVQRRQSAAPAIAPVAIGTRAERASADRRNRPVPRVRRSVLS
jgi:hypothetical protein